ncbi:MAG: sugar phosphate nucleotidyltransferase [Bryobacteraceae bacterium]
MEESLHANTRRALILEGGSGLRLWPLSRPTQPAQLIPSWPLAFLRVRLKSGRTI